MARARVWSETSTYKVRGGRKKFRYWCFTVTAWNGVVLTDNGYGSQDAALADADRLVRAVELIEKRGHKLRPWRELVDQARSA